MVKGPLTRKDSSDEGVSRPVDSIGDERVARLASAV